MKLNLRDAALIRGATRAATPQPHYHLHGIAKMIPFNLIALEVLPEGQLRTPDRVRVGLRYSDTLKEFVFDGA